MIFTIGYLVAFCGIAFSVWALQRGALSVLPILLTSGGLLNACMAGKLLVYSPFAIIWSRMGAYYNAQNNILYYIFILALYSLVFAFFHRSIFSSAVETRKFLTQMRGGILVGAALFMMFYAILHISVLDLNAVWQSNEYLFLASIKALKTVTKASVFIQGFYKTVGLFTFVLLAMSVVSRNRLAMFILLMPCTWFFCYELAGHSRYAMVYMAVAGGILLYGKRQIAGLIFLTVALFAFASALGGRGSGAHGLAELMGIFAEGLSLNAEQAMRMYTNFFEGVFVQGEVFFYTDFSHEQVYKNLSFSPFPSAIDSFSTRALPYGIRYHTYVPMGATSEALLFGSGYFVLFWAGAVSAYSATIILLKRRAFALFAITFALFLLCIQLQFAYPIRWVFRFYVAISLTAFVPFFFRQLR